VAETVNAVNEIIIIGRDELLERANEMKHAGRRLSQACAASIDGHYELLYSFADDEKYNYTSFKVVVETDVHVPSVTAIYPYANFYESEMSELYGVKIDMIDGDYHGRLYRIKEVTPFAPKEADK
jgi:ech hydrogenase subunit D